VIISGQSNAAGRNADEYPYLFPAWSQGPQPGVIEREWTNQGATIEWRRQWLNYRGSISNVVGPLLLDRGWAPAILHYAVGGTSITQWIGALYAPYLAWLRSGLSTLVNPVIRGFIWYQGEADVQSSVAWNTDMATLAAQLRSDLAVPNLPIVNTRLPTSWGTVGYPGVTPANLGPFQRLQDLFVAADRKATSVEDPVATFDSSKVHIDAPSTVRIGTKQARALMSLCGVP
jgi:hypothetical protein